ncbi:hypothetical protein DRQ26_02960 [bacterium]|nr:MAG: hypothetical protein DRQ26_02960 [bacterium]
MKDNYKIRFGKYKGTPIGEVRAQYLLWLYTQPWLEVKYPEIAVYVGDNLLRLSKMKKLENEGFQYDSEDPCDATETDIY